MILARLQLQQSLELHLVEQRELQQMSSDLDLVSAAQKLAGDNRGSIQQGAVCRTEILEIVVTGRAFSRRTGYLRVLSGTEVVFQNQVGLCPAADDRLLIFDPKRKADGFALQDREHWNPFAGWVGRLDLDPRGSIYVIHCASLPSGFQI